MNERIQELLNKACVYAYEQNPGENSYGRPVDENKYEEDRYTKFAELIVQECLNIVEPDEDSGDEWCVALKGAAQEIYEHFGVEE